MKQKNIPEDVASLQAKLGYYKHVNRGGSHTTMRRMPHDDAANATRYSAANAVCSLTFLVDYF